MPMAHGRAGHAAGTEPSACKKYRPMPLCRRCSLFHQPSRALLLGARVVASRPQGARRTPPCQPEPASLRTTTAPSVTVCTRSALTAAPSACRREWSGSEPPAQTRADAAHLRYRVTGGNPASSCAPGSSRITCKILALLPPEEGSSTVGSCAGRFSLSFTATRPTRRASWLRHQPLAAVRRLRDRVPKHSRPVWFRH